MVDSTGLGNGSLGGAKSRRLIVIAWVFTAIIVGMLSFTYYGISLMSAGRAYVGGEGLWSKAQKDMVYSLARYAQSKKPDDYQTYLDSAEVILGDRQARLELEKATPDLAVAKAGFLRGRNHPDDIDGMISLVRDFRHVPDIDKVVSIWTQADADIDQLMSVGAKIHTTVQSGSEPADHMLPLLQELSVINQRLMPLEDAFSSTLGEAARKTQQLLIMLLFAGATLLMTLAFLFSRRIIGQNAAIEKALRAGEKQMRDMLRFAPLPITISRISDQAVLFANDHALRQFKLTHDELSSIRSYSFYNAKEDREKLLAHLNVHRTAENWEVQMCDANGDMFWASMSCKCILYNGDECVLTALQNIDLHKRNQLELQHRAFHDELTGLPNRAMFMSTLDDRFERARREESQFALLFLDIDRFKTINDELGHSIGDAVLQEVARRLADCVTSADTVARLGGDEFVILIASDAQPASLQVTAERIMDTMRAPLSANGHEMEITISMGISCYPKNGADTMELMRNADLAMYRAKEFGRNNSKWCEKNPSDPELSNPAPKVRTYVRPEKSGRP